jgi:hypothetical protein
MEAEKAVQIERRRRTVRAFGRGGQADGGSVPVVGVLAMGRNDVQAVRSAAQENCYQNIALRLRPAGPQGQIGQG